MTSTRPLIALVLALSTTVPATAQEKPKVFRVGAYAIDITPTKFPVIVNGMFDERTANRASDPLHSRCLILDDGSMRLALVIVDSLMMPRALLDDVKKLASEGTGVAVENMLIAATHTHSAPSVMGCLGSGTDPNYASFLVPQIVRGMQLAVKNLGPARVGWTVIQDPEHTFCRRWIRRPDRIITDPFGASTVRANMHPGHQNPDAIGPSGPVDPDLTLLSFQSPDGKPLALLANYSMHYYGSTPVSADYYGRFAEQIQKLLGAEAPFVGIMSQGTSGDLMWMDYGKPRVTDGYDKYAAAVARVAHQAYKEIRYHDWVPLAMREQKLSLRRRVADEKRLEWARTTYAAIKDKPLKGRPEIYAREQLLIAADPTAELKLQAVRIGDFGIATFPNEVFGITGLKIKAQSPLQLTCNIELANGAEGYIPPPEQHFLGGYTTWAARTAGLEVQAEPRIVETLLGLLEQVAGKPRRPLVDAHGLYAKEVLASRPLAYWRLTELAGSSAHDAAGNNTATYEDGSAFYLEGPQAATFSGDKNVNRAVHFAGGRLKANLKELGNSYSVELWFWNGLPDNARPVTGYLYGRGDDGVADGDHLGLGGTDAAQGKLFFASGAKSKQVLAGTTKIGLKSWNHMVLVRDGKKVRVHLNGNPEPELAGDSGPSTAGPLFFAGRHDRSATWEGKLDEVAVYGRTLTAEEVARHFKASGMRAP